jgi:hypothetical protein
MIVVSFPELIVTLAIVVVVFLGYLSPSSAPLR